MKKYFFVVNPVSGGGKGRPMFEQAMLYLDEKGVEYSYKYTSYAKEAYSIVREAIERGEKNIVAAGGDGTVREVASMLSNTGIVMGILPLGTGNDLAFCLNIPSDPRKAVDILLEDNPRAIDAGMANDMFFINVAGFGFDVDVIKNTEKYKRKFSGMVPYMLGILRTMFHLDGFDVIIDINGVQNSYKALMVSVCNGTRLGGGMNISPLSEQDDGLFDVMVLRKVNLIRFLRLLVPFVKGRHIGIREFDFYKAKEVRCQSSVPFELNLDGDLDSCTPVTFSILPKAVEMLLPKA